MHSENKPLISKNNAQHFEIVDHCNHNSVPPAFGAIAKINASEIIDESIPDSKVEGELNGATVFQTSLNIAKLCMGTGTLALPFAAQKGGLLFNIVGLGVVVVWNYYSADCLLRCLDYIPHEGTARCDRCNNNNNKEDRVITTELPHQIYGTSGGMQIENREGVQIGSLSRPPEGTTMYGTVAWHAFGRPGLVVLDSLMIMLFVGLLTSYQAAMLSFIDGINETNGTSKWDEIFPGVMVAILSCAEDISFLSKFSAIGLMALALSFGVISYVGVKENGWIDLTDILQLNLWPDSVSDASSWFGVVVFGYGVVPVIFNIKDSMSNPQLIGLSTKIGLAIAYFGYLFASSGIRILFSRTHSFEGDVLQALPNSPISLIVRLMMTCVVAVTAPFIVVPCGEMIEGKLNLDGEKSRNRIIVRSLLCAICTLLAVFVPGFVHIISFVGCFCVSMTGFVLPPLFSIQLKKARQQECRSDFCLLLVGIITTAITSAMTFRNLVDYSAIKVHKQTVTAGDHML